MQVVYRPRSYPDGTSDPAVCLAYGRKFQANIPVELTDRDTVLQLLVEPNPLVIGKTHGVERYVPISQAMVGNPSFEIIGTPRGKPGRKAAPKTADEYRAYALAWLAITEDADDLTERWNDEAKLRETCGVSESDLDLIEPQFTAKYHQLNPDGSTFGGGGDPKWAPMSSDADAA
jgi:hypothetical protein